jgi:haloalkane dehalogenase
MRTWRIGPPRRLRPRRHGVVGQASDSGPGRYHFAEQCDHLFALWDALELGDNVVLVLHDWGSALGFHWANQHRDRVAGIAFMEGIVKPITWDEFRAGCSRSSRASLPAGEEMVLEHNMFVEAVLPGAIMRTLTDEEMDHYRAPFARPGEGRRPTLSWPRNIPIDGEPADVTAIVRDYGAWLETSTVPKLFVNAEPGSLMRGGPGLRADLPEPDGGDRAGHALHQEDSPHEIGTAIAQFVQELRR